MKALTYIEHGKFTLVDRPKPVILDPRDAVAQVTLGAICTSDLHIKHGSVPRAVPGITVGREMVGVVEEVGSAVTTVKPVTGRLENSRAYNRKKTQAWKRELPPAACDFFLTFPTFPITIS